MRQCKYCLTQSHKDVCEDCEYEMFLNSKDGEKYFCNEEFQETIYEPTISFGDILIDRLKTKTIEYYIRETEKIQEMILRGTINSRLIV